MYKNYSYLNNKTFLHKICASKNTSNFVKVTCLSWKEQPIREVQGEISTGSFNIDGNSSIRRTGSLNFVVGDFNPLTDINSIFAINKKIYLEVGLKNNTKEYTDYSIIWFPMGLYVVTAASCAHNSAGININLQLKDKMCLLNGECGGTIPAAVTFSSVETIDKDGNTIQSQPTIFQIIQELVHHFGKEDLSKILISDLDLQIKQVMKWSNTNPLYISRNRSQENEFRITTNYQEYSQSLNQGFSAVEGSPFGYGKDVGYIYTDFTYPGELVCDAGNTITSVLDKIVSVLTNFEYFYDVYGNFIFREKKNYLNNSQTKDLISKIKESGSLELSDYIIDLSHGKASYVFENSDLILSYSNTPQYGMIKNDFVAWGIRKGQDGNESGLVRYHLAIDEKPTVGHTYKAFQYEDPYDGIKKWHSPIWYQQRSNFPSIGAEGVYYYDEQANRIYTWQNSQYVQVNTILKEVTTTDWRTQLYFQGVVAQPLGLESNDYYTELKNEWPKIYNIKADESANISVRATAVPKGYLYYNTVGNYYYCTSDQCLYKVINYGVFNDTNYQKISPSFFTKPSGQIQENSSYNFTITKVNNSGFKQEIFTDPMSMDYFLDFIDTNSRMQYISKNEIGNRSYAVQLEELNCVFEPVMPDVILINIDDPNASTIRNECIRKNQVFYQVSSNIYDMLNTGGTFNSCYEYIRQLIHQYTNYNENISITCIPLYFLQPNTRIYLRDDESGIEGDFVINTISFGLNAGNNMTITATKALSKI